RERPTLTGGAAYRQWLSASDTVSAGSGSAAH
ncbi:LysB family phage lysis regulatory protein, partial [Escherichia coli]|nr:LysB family phage lysis regulatory protein [Escherichia coli]